MVRDDAHLNLGGAFKNLGQARVSPIPFDGKVSGVAGPTKDLQELIGQGGANLRLLAAPGVTPLEGAVPIVADGKIIGAIGVSGATSAQDAQCAMAGAAAAIGK